MLQNLIIYKHFQPFFVISNPSLHLDPLTLSLLTDHPSCTHSLPSKILPQTHWPIHNPMVIKSSLTIHKTIRSSMSIMLKSKEHSPDSNPKLSKFIQKQISSSCMTIKKIEKKVKPNNSLCINWPFRTKSDKTKVKKTASKLTLTMGKSTPCVAVIQQPSLNKYSRAKPLSKSTNLKPHNILSTWSPNRSITWHLMEWTSSKKCWFPKPKHS